MLIPTIPYTMFSALCGLAMGLTYGTLMLIQRNKVKDAAIAGISRGRVFMMMAIISAIRVGILAIALIYLLRTERADPIILLVSFLAAFFVTLITERAVKGGRP